MRKCIILFLITGILWAQTDFDKLVLKDGTEYLGEYSRIEKRVVYFKQKEGLAFQPVFMKLVSILELKDGRVLIDEGLLTKQTTLNSEQYEKLTNEEKAVFIEIKAVYDAKKEAKKWLAYPLLTGCTFVSSTFGSLIIGVEPWENILSIIGISTASLFVPYYRFKYLDKNQSAKISSENIELYKRIYSEEFKKRKSKNIVKGFGLLGLTAAGGLAFFLATFKLQM